jgi:pilus assembly protein Flp/PilA
MIATGTRLLIELIKDEAGQNLTEYALIAGFIGVGAIMAMTNITTKVHTVFNALGNHLTNAV